MKAIVLLILFFPVVAWSQNDTTPVTKNTFSAGLNYQSKLHYFGRTDNLQSSGFFPTVGYEFKEGFYGNANFIFTNNSSSSLTYNGTIVEGGYRLPTTKNFSGNLFYSQFLYSDSSQLVQSAIKSQTGVNLAYNNKIVNVNVGGDAKFSDRTDFGATAGLDHLFLYLIPNTKTAVALNPSAYAYAGTQNFSNTYIRQNRNGIPLPVIGGGGNRETVTETKTAFNILAYEFSMPVVIVAGKFNASFTPSYIMPQNIITVPNRPDLSENGKNMFYFSAGIGVRL